MGFGVETSCQRNRLQRALVELSLARETYSQIGRISTIREVSAGTKSDYKILTFIIYKTLHKAFRVLDYLLKG